MGADATTWSVTRCHGEESMDDLYVCLCHRVKLGKHNRITKSLVYFHIDLFHTLCILVDFIHSYNHK